MPSPGLLSASSAPPFPFFPAPHPALKQGIVGNPWFWSPAGFSLITMPVCWFIKGEKDKHYLGWGGLARRKRTCVSFTKVVVGMVLHFLSWKNAFIFHYLS